MSNEATLELAREFGTQYEDGSVEFEVGALLRFVEVLRTELARELLDKPSKEPS